MALHACDFEDDAHAGTTSDSTTLANCLGLLLQHIRMHGDVPVHPPISIIPCDLSCDNGQVLVPCSSILSH